MTKIVIFVEDKVRGQGGEGESPVSSQGWVYAWGPVQGVSPDDPATLIRE